VSNDIPSNSSSDHKGSYGMLPSSDDVDQNINAPSSTEPVGIDYFEDADTAEAPPATLERLSDLAKQARELEHQINEEVVALEEKKGQLDKILKRFIPGIMEELGMAEFKLTDGASIKIKESIAASISAENKPAAFAWLADHDYDGIIKTKVLSEFGRGDIERAKALMKIIDGNGFESTLDQSVHPMTLKSFVKERLEAGESIPVDLFGVFEIKEAKITLPKKRK
jgi:hypothetical protein